MQRRMYLPLAVAVTLLIGPGNGYGEVPLGNEFTYQGQLKDGGAPADGYYDFIFLLYDAQTGGAQVGNEMELDEVFVSDGLFTVELDFGSSAFAGDARWLQVSVRDSDLGGEYADLSPRQSVTAAPVALYALDGPGSTGYWGENGTAIYNTNAGGVGIGTTSPDFNLHVYEVGSGGFYPPARLGTEWYLPSIPDPQNDWFTIEVGGDLTIPAWGPGTRLVRESGTALRFETEDTMNSAFRTTQMTLDADGKLGIGTTTPIALLEAVSDSGEHGIRATTSGIPVAAIRTSTSGSWPAVHAESASSGSGATGIRSFLTSTSPGSGSAAILGSVNGATMYGYGVHGSHAGYGIGVYGDSVNGTGVYAKSTNGWALYAETENGTTAARFVGNVEILSPSTQQILIEFGEGLDYAEGFNVTDENQITPGTVLVIDEQNAGNLAVSSQSYDRKVAGIVAGANGLGSAVRLGAGQYDYDVALAGRVYCNVDASHGAIQPGDLLTTSPTPGFAMKVTNHERAQGAILGKAMQPLKQGERGQILVLVTLQ